MSNLSATDQLSRIGFRTLSDGRAFRAAGTYARVWWRTEFIITDKCNFRCGYCRGPKQERAEVMLLPLWETLLQHMSNVGMIAVRFSGGEPATHHDLPAMISRMSGYTDACNIALSTNGSATQEVYEHLMEVGAGEFSISLDGCTPEDVREMSGGIDAYDRIVSNIKYLSKRAHVTVGMVFNEQNADKALESIRFAHELGVADIRILSSAQYNKALEGLDKLPESILDAHPVLKYRVNRFRAGLPVRGLSLFDAARCSLVEDDVAIAGKHHYPCIIYLREGGAPIGVVNSGMWKERQKWSKEHDSATDPICAQNCLDVCAAYNNRVEEFRAHIASGRPMPY